LREDGDAEKWAAKLPRLTRLAKKDESSEKLKELKSAWSAMTLSLQGKLKSLLEATVFEEIQSLVSD
jgi:hypothetical protein